MLAMHHHSLFPRRLSRNSHASSSLNLRSIFVRWWRGVYGSQSFLCSLWGVGIFLCVCLGFSFFGRERENSQCYLHFYGLLFLKLEFLFFYRLERFFVCVLFSLHWVFYLVQFVNGVNNFRYWFYFSQKTGLLLSF